MWRPWNWPVPLLTAAGGGAGALAYLCQSIGINISIIVILAALAAFMWVLAGRLAFAEHRREARAHRELFSVRRLYETSAYNLGIDREDPDASKELAAGQAEVPYVPRDCDQQVRHALQSAIASLTTRLVVIEGVSKAGKSRTLFQAVQCALPGSTRVIVPKGLAGFNELAKAGPPFPRRRIREGLQWLWAHVPFSSKAMVDRDMALVWLDDLEPYMSDAIPLDGEGLQKSFGSWWCQVVLAATCWGKGSTTLAQDESSRIRDPLLTLLKHPIAKDLRIELTDRLDDGARAFIEARCGPDTVDNVAAVGIGAYMVAASQLWARLVYPLSEEGAAVAWATIDWRRSGIVDPVPEHSLRAIWQQYLVGKEPTHERFKAGLEWAQQPLWKGGTVRLIAFRDGGFAPYDWLAQRADLDNRPILSSGWDVILSVATPNQAFAMGLTAYGRTHHE